jgi:hypothetical protein
VRQAYLTLLGLDAVREINRELLSQHNRTAG